MPDLSYKPAASNAVAPIPATSRRSTDKSRTNRQKHSQKNEIIPLPSAIEELASQLPATTPNYADVQVDMASDQRQAIIGPRMKIHRYDVGLRLLHCLLIIWLLSGFSFLTCVTLCICVNVGYVSFKSEGSSVFVVLAFTFYCFYVFKIYNTFMRTFIRMCKGIWSLNHDEKSEFIALRWVDPLFRRVQMARGLPEDVLSTELHQRHVGHCKLFTTFMIVTCAFGLPLVYTAVLYGYWAVVDVICVTLVLGSSFAIMTTNFLARCYRFLQFMKLLYNELYCTDGHVPERLKAAFLASTGQDHGKNFIDFICIKAVKISFIVLVCSFIFNALLVNWTAVIFSLSCIGFFGLVRLRRFIPGYSNCVETAEIQQRAEPRTLVSPHSNPESATDSAKDDSVPVSMRVGRRINRLVTAMEWEGHYSGSSSAPIVTVILIRSLCFAIGFTSLNIFDMSRIETSDGRAPIQMEFPSPRSIELILYTLLFLVITLLKDIIFVVPLKKSQVLRPLLLTVLQFGQLAIAGFGRSKFAGFTFVAAAMLSIYGLDYRDARWYWTSINDKSLPSRRRIRAMQNIFLLLFTLLFFLGISVLVGFAVGILRTAPISHQDDLTFSTNTMLSDQAISPSSAASRSSFTTIICGLRFTTDDLTVIDLATMSKASYQSNSTEALKFLHRWNPKLSSWQLGKYNLESNHIVDSNVNVKSGIRFAEFINPQTQLSVIAVRGTSSLEDIFQDMYLWSTVGLLQMSSYFGTVINLWPVQTVAETVYLIQEAFSVPTLIYWAEMESIIAEIQASKPTLSSTVGSSSVAKESRVMLTGHSLGGGLANIIAGHLDIPSVVFSAPGLGYSTISYNITVENIQANTINVIPRSDPVPKIDKQISTVYNLPCDAGEPLSCHDLSRTVKTLVEICNKM